MLKKKNDIGEKIWLKPDEIEKNFDLACPLNPDINKGLFEYYLINTLFNSWFYQVDIPFNMLYQKSRIEIGQVGHISILDSMSSLRHKNRYIWIRSYITYQFIIECF